MDEIDELNAAQVRFSLGNPEPVGIFFSDRVKIFLISSHLFLEYFMFYSITISIISDILFINL